VARWDLSARETAGMFRRLALEASGIALELPWPADPPKHGRLELFVRFITSDRRELEARQQLDLTPPGPANALLASSRSGGDIDGDSPATPAASAASDTSTAERSPRSSSLASHWETKPRLLPAAAVARAEPMANAAKNGPAENGADEPSPSARARAARPEWSPYRPSP
jgi:hypothetical protein